MMRAGMAHGITLPRPAMAKVVPQLREIVTARLTDNIFWAPIAAMPRRFPRKIASASATPTRPRSPRKCCRRTRGSRISSSVTIYRRRAPRLAGPICPTARPGIAGAFAGATTMDMSADEIHRLGLAEVARIRGEMLTVKKQVGFKGDLDAFFKYLEEDPRFYFNSEDELLGRLSRREAAHRCAAAEAVRRLSEGGLRNSCGRGIPCGFGGGRLRTRRLRPTANARASSTSTPTTSKRSRASGSRRCRCTRRLPVTISRYPSSRSSPTCRASAVSTATCRTRKAGRCTRNPSARSSACSPIRTSGTEGCPTKCCAPCAWWWTPGSTPRAGAASRPSSTCSTTHRWPRAT